MTHRLRVRRRFHFKPQPGQLELPLVIITARLDVRKALSRTDVLRAIDALGTQYWTIADLAEAMAEREYRVRAAVGWLLHQGRVIPEGELDRTSPTGRKYPVTLYRIQPEKKPADFAGLYRAFGLK